jgi:hypothetical protein
LGAGVGMGPRPLRPLFQIRNISEMRSPRLAARAALGEPPDRADPCLLSKLIKQTGAGCLPVSGRAPAEPTQETIPRTSLAVTGSDPYWIRPRCCGSPHQRFTDPIAAEFPITNCLTAVATPPSTTCIRRARALLARRRRCGRTPRCILRQSGSLRTNPPGRLPLAPAGRSRLCLQTEHSCGSRARSISQR